MRISTAPGASAAHRPQPAQRSPPRTRASEGAAGTAAGSAAGGMVVSAREGRQGRRAERRKAGAGRRKAGWRACRGGHIGSRRDRGGTGRDVRENAPGVQPRPGAARAQGPPSSPPPAARAIGAVPETAARPPGTCPGGRPPPPFSRSPFPGSRGRLRVRRPPRVSGARAGQNPRIVEAGPPGHPAQVPAPVRRGPRAGAVRWPCADAEGGPRGKRGRGEARAGPAGGRRTRLARGPHGPRARDVQDRGRVLTARAGTAGPVGGSAPGPGGGSNGERPNREGQSPERPMPRRACGVEGAMRGHTGARAAPFARGGPFP